MRRGILAVTVVGLLGGLLSAGLPAAAVQPAEHTVVTNPDPVNWTPHVLDGDVRAVVEVGNRVVVGGTFSRVSNAAGTVEYPRSNLFTFDAPSGNVVTTFAPSVPSMVYALADAGDGSTVYVAGQFANINGAANTSRIARVNVTTGAVVSSFRSPGFDGVIKSVVLRGSKLYVGGTFDNAGGTPRVAMALLNKDTGALDNSLNLGFSDPRNGGETQVLKFDVTPDGSRAVAIGNFTRINGLDRYQIGLLDLTTTPVSVFDWSTQRYTSPCSSSFQSYMRDIDISRDGSYFAVVTTGAYGGGAPQNVLCDTATRWELGPTGANQQPTWVNYTGGDTLLSVAAAGEAVYIGGHNRWVNNPFAADRAGQGAVPRPGIGALDPLNGMPLTWNPERTLGVGVNDLVATDRGLWVGSDTERIGNFEYHGRIALMPLSGGATLPANFTGQLPSDVYSLGSPVAPTDGVIRRAFTGTSVTGSSSVPNGGVAWGRARGAFMVDGTAYYGWDDGTFQARSFDGTTFGPATTLNLYGLTNFANELRTITGSFYDRETGRLYFTLSGQSSLFYRYFTPESQIVGAQRFTAVGNISGLNWSTVSSMFQVDDYLYVASSIDGNLRRYSWTSAGAVQGNLPIAGSGVVVSGPLVDGQNWRARGVFAYAPADGGTPPNQPPVSSFTSSCSGLACTFTSTSTDPDGSVVGGTWDFGDGASGTTYPTATRTYGAPGTYTVRLTVSDDDGATGTTAQSITVSNPPASSIGFRAAASSDANTTAARVTVPSSVVSGDAMLLFVTANTSTTSISTPAGWTRASSVPGSSMQSVLFHKIATAADPGQELTVALSGVSKTSLQVVAYSGTSATPFATVAGAAETVSRPEHTTPAVSVSQNGSLVVSYWSDKSSATTGWTLPGSVIQRGQTVGTAAGRITSVLADSGSGVPAGPAGGLTATANSANINSVTWTVVLSPGT